MAKIKQIKFTELMKEFKKYVAKKNDVRYVESQEHLKYVYFDGEHFMATNALVLLRVSVEHVSEIPVELTTGGYYCPFKNEVVEMDKKYPNLDRLIPDGGEHVIRINHSAERINTVLRECVASFDKKTEQDERFVEILFDNPNIGIMSVEGNKKVHENQINNCHYLSPTTADKTVVRARAQFMRNALITVRKLYKLSDKNTELSVVSPMRPIYFGQEGVFDLIVMPVRVKR